MKTTWNIHEAILLCRQIEEIAPNHGCHVALTGGCLSKAGALIAAEIDRLQRLSEKGGEL